MDHGFFGIDCQTMTLSRLKMNNLNANTHERVFSAPEFCCYQQTAVMMSHYLLFLLKCVVIFLVCSPFFFFDVSTNSETLSGKDHCSSCQQN